MLDVVFKPEQSYWKQLKFTMLHGAFVGFGLGFGVAVLVIVLGWLHLLPPTGH